MRCYKKTFVHAFTVALTCVAGRVQDAHARFSRRTLSSLWVERPCRSSSTQEHRLCLASPFYQENQCRFWGFDSLISQSDLRFRFPRETTQLFSLPSRSVSSDNLTLPHSETVSTTFHFHTISPLLIKGFGVGCLKILPRQKQWNTSMLRTPRKKTHLHTSKRRSWCTCFFTCMDEESQWAIAPENGSKCWGVFLS